MHQANTMELTTPIREEPPFALTRAETESALWERLSAYLLADLTHLRERNDAVLDIRDTTLLRGEIRAVKRILALADEAGQESRQIESEDGPEFALSRLNGGN
jgi:hypothetical protein